MKEKDDIQFANIMATLAAAYQKEISSETVGVFRKFLADIDIKDLEKAVVEIVMTRSDNRFPSVADIRKTIKGCSDESIEEQAVAQWGFLLNHSHCALTGKEGARFFEKLEHQESSSPSHSIINISISTWTEQAVIMAFGGFSQFFVLDTKNENWDRFHFIKCYKAIAKPQQRKMLIGGSKVKLLKE